MKHFKAIIIAMICVLIAGLAVSLAVIRHYGERSSDVILLNDIALTALHDPEFTERDFGVDYALLDSDGKIFFSTTDTDISSVMDALKGHYPSMALTDGERFMGTVILLESLDSSYEKQRNTALLAIFLSELGIIALMVIWGVYVRKSVVEPFRKMEHFAEEIAGGNLEIPLEMSRDNMFGAFTESFDIMREELAAARDREIQLKQREKELIASLSHDLKTPITGIKLTAELMQAQTSDSAQLEKLGNICKKAEQIDALVSDLFTATLKDLGEIKVSVTDEMSSVLTEMVKRCDDRQLIRQGTVPDCLISIDKRRMEQIIWNIVSNSCKYAGTPIEVTYESAGEHLKMSIRDFGSGVSPDEIQLVTNKFYRSRSSADSGIEGSGLGLYIAKTLMENMGGEIRCLNAEPGFEVWLFIPLT